MPYLIDTHSHLDAEIYERDLDVVIKHALQEDVWTVTVGSDYASSVRAVEIAERFPTGVYAAVGLHPNRIPSDLSAADKLLNLEKFAELAMHPKVVALGETGLDFSDLPVGYRGGVEHQMAEKMRTSQKIVFGKFLDLSRELRLPLLLHCRDAQEDMLDMLETWDKTTRGFDSRGILHGFTGSWKEARRFFNLDFLISVTGIIAHGAYQSELVRKAPLNRIVLESDCPHLTAAPWNLRRSEPGYLPSVLASVAGTRGEAPDVVARETTRNALGVLKKIMRTE
jgi:TatD DNase family protein